MKYWEVMSRNYSTPVGLFLCIRKLPECLQNGSGEELHTFSPYSGHSLRNSYPGQFCRNTNLWAYTRRYQMSIFPQAYHRQKWGGAGLRLTSYFFFSSLQLSEKRSGKLAKKRRHSMS